MKETPADYIKRRCTERFISHKELMGGSQRRPIVRLRHTLCVELNVKFGLSAARIGQMLGGRDHTTVIGAWRKFGHTGDSRTRRRLTDEQKQRIRDLFDSGMPVADVARAVGCAHSTVADMVLPEVKERRTRARKRDALVKMAANESLRRRYAVLDSHT